MSAIRKRWLKEIVADDGRWNALQDALGMRLIPETLGCGSFGCVFADADPNSPWVVKITVDPNEAFMWRRILKITEDAGYGEEGYAQVRSITRLLPDAGSRKMYAIVREAVAPVFDERGWTDFSRQVVAPSQLPEGIPFMSHDLENIERPARDLVLCIRYVQNYHGAARVITGGSANYPHEKQAAEVKLQRAIDYLQSEYTWTLGQTLEVLKAHNVILEDLRPANVGWRFHDQFLDDNEDYVIVAFDPGGTRMDRHVKKSLGEFPEAMVANHSDDWEWYVPPHIAR